MDDKLSKHQGVIDKKPKWLTEELHDDLNRLAKYNKSQAMKGLLSPSYANGYAKAIQDVLGIL